MLARGYYSRLHYDLDMLGRALHTRTQGVGRGIIGVNILAHGLAFEHLAIGYGGSAHSHRTDRHWITAAQSVGRPYDSAGDGEHRARRVGTAVDVDTFGEPSRTPLGVKAHSYDGRVAGSNRLFGILGTCASAVGTHPSDGHWLGASVDELKLTVDRAEIFVKSSGNHAPCSSTCFRHLLSGRPSPLRLRPNIF